MTELIFEVCDAKEGGFNARALGKPIVTQADTWEELRHNILETVEVFFDSANEKPKLIRLHYVRDEILVVNAATRP